MRDWDNLQNFYSIDMYSLKVTGSDNYGGDYYAIQEREIVIISYMIGIKNQ